MRIILFTIGACFILSSGCQLVPTDMFPKVRWYWSKDAIQYRQDKKNSQSYKHQ